MDKFTDPVCGMDVTAQSAVAKSEHHGSAYYFCSLGCKESFDREPDKYLVQVAADHDHACCC